MKCCWVMAEITKRCVRLLFTIFLSHVDPFHELQDRGEEHRRSTDGRKTNMAIHKMIA